MALAKWIGFVAAQPGPNPGHSVADEPSADCAKATVALAKAEHKQFGLENFGNTCYVNSVLQALYFCHPFRELVTHVHSQSVLSTPPNPFDTPSLPTTSADLHARSIRKPSSFDAPKARDNPTINGTVTSAAPSIPPSPPTMFAALRALFVYISGNAQDKGTISPRAFVEKLKKENELFRSTMHQDAHEFLIYLLNKIAEDLEEEARNARSRSSSGDDLSSSVMSSGPSTLGTALSGTNSMTNSTIVHDLFEGVLTSETRCLTCETVSSRDEAFLDLSLDIEQNSSVTACLRQFSASEMLCQKNKFFCDSCCGLQEAEKRMKIKRLPNVLALHLKRFKYQEDLGKYIKLMYRVAFPLELRLFNTVDDAQDPDRLYELFAIVVHIGNGPHHGHYVAIVKSRGSWVLFDDDSVDTIKESDIPKYFGDSSSGCAYVLYYQAVDLDLAALGLKSEDPPITETVHEASPLQAPILPPGLTHEGDSDASEFVPTTPASPATVAVPTIVSNSPPPLSVAIPPPSISSIPIPVVTPTATSPNGKSGGFFTSLRHSPSKPYINSGNRSSVHNVFNPPVPPVPPVPLVPAALISPKINMELSETSTSTASTAITPNNKVKAPKEKPSGWFTRKRSARPEKEKPPRRPATSQGTTEHHDSSSFTSSSASSRAPLAPDSSPNLRASVPAAETSSPALPAFPRSPQLRPLRPHSSTTFHNDSPSSSTPITSSHAHELPGPGHKKSQPVLNGGSSSKLPFARPPKRPSTASGAISPSHGTFARLDEEVPVPPLPSDLKAPTPRTRNTDTTLLTEDSREWRRSSALVPPPPPPSASTKRTSRKLSFSGGMLGFGRKDKDKDKDKDRHRDKDSAGGFSQASINGPSLVASLPSNGHL
ncbi:hypothetical protein M0805_001437 [Coniferiporia weirii]|nr:hypothetical protein M0805_001437 [Coniferiporia weirii]